MSRVTDREVAHQTLMSSYEATSYKTTQAEITLAAHVRGDGNLGFDTPSLRPV